MEKQNKTTIIVVCGPSEDERTETKDEFWKKLAETIEEVRGRLIIIIIGDLNGRVGKADEESGETIGAHGETIRNNNGKRLIDFCLMNNLIITNTFFQHKEIHKITREVTREVANRGERSIIDYVIIGKDFRKEVQDTRVRRGAKLFTDHYLVMTKVKIKNCRDAEQKKKQSEKEVIQTYKLRQKECTERYREKIEIEMAKIKENTNINTLEEQWKIFKETIIETARITCGLTKINKGKKQTRWWSEEIKAEIKTKKNKWIKYLSKRNNENYNAYKTQRIKVKELFKKAKQNTWEEFGEKMEQDSKASKEGGMQLCIWSMK
ncbi:unnamed protein product [Brassicogethes aeneus]|uniref:Endonuclease/exonuclease/phosphatase domain-containing protein n=1 Tax=Brassicogethes aeneus TaxID=1431903 RepID=A0A9P0FHZ5_BRAAE|nr:unnamed protein product [Brassicogethes aeneus]